MKKAITILLIFIMIFTSLPQNRVLALNTEQVEALNEGTHEASGGFWDNANMVVASICGGIAVVIPLALQSLLTLAVQNEDYAYINMEDMYENIAVYKKYLTDESIFENGNLPKEKYCMMPYYENENGLTYINEYNDNLFIHTRLNVYNDRLGIISDYYKENFNKMINSLKAQADNNKNEVKYVFGIGEATACNSEWLIETKYTNLSYLYYKEYEYTMSKDEYINNFREDMFISNIRNPYRGTVDEYNEDKVSYKKNVYAKYNYIDKQYGEIKELKLNEVFVPEYDYVSILKERIKRELNDYMVEGSYYLETYGKEVFDTALLELEQKTQVDYIMKIGTIEIEYNLLYNTIIGYFEGEENYEGYSIYISDVLDFGYLK